MKSGVVQLVRVHGSEQLCIHVRCCKAHFNSSLTGNKLLHRHGSSPKPNFGNQNDEVSCRREILVLAHQVKVLSTFTKPDFTSHNLEQTRSVCSLPTFLDRVVPEEF
jgi:hypothetical protein